MGSMFCLYIHFHTPGVQVQTPSQSLPIFWSFFCPAWYVGGHRSASQDDSAVRERPRCLGAALLAALEVVTWEAAAAQLPQDAPAGQAMRREAKQRAAAQIMLVTTGPVTLVRAS